MAITNAQQYKQLMQNGGRIGLQGGGRDSGKDKGTETGREGRDNREIGARASRTRAAAAANQRALAALGDPDPEVDVPTSQRQDTITSFGKNLRANLKSNPFSMITPLGTLLQTAYQTNKARDMLGLTTSTDDDDDTGNGDGEQNIIPLMAQAPSIVEQELELEPEQKDSEEEGLFRRFRAEGGIMNTDVVGGEMDFDSARQMYGLGKLVKKITRSVKKVAKSPIGKAAIGYALTGGLSNLAAGQSFGTNFFSPTSFISKGGIKNIFTKGGLQNIGSKLGFGNIVGTSDGGTLFQKNLLGKIATSPTGIIAGTSLIAGALTAEQEEEAQQISDETGINIDEIRANPNKYLARRFRAEGGIMRTNYAEGSEDTENLSNDANYKGWVKVYEANPEAAEMNENHSEYLQFYNRKAEGGSTEGKEPVAKKVMPLLDMEGQEKDYRETGGFVDMGRMEKADDVPARLSKNEFVFTADAVRNAGDGSVDKGAEVMYNMMKNLESGGDVSEESQGLEGARKMFQTSQRLEEVL